MCEETRDEKNDNSTHGKRQKTIIVVSGNASAGKTSTIKNVAKNILERYAVDISRINWNATEIKIIVTSNNSVTIFDNNGNSNTGHGKIKIGIASRGDDFETVKENIDFFVKSKCDIIITATRLRKSPNEVNGIAKDAGYQIIWTSPIFVVPKTAMFENYQDKINQLSATQICKIFDNILKGEYAS